MAANRIQFLYFDLGNVLLTFDPVRLCEQVSSVTGVEPQRVRQILFQTDLYLQYECGKVDSRFVHARFLELASVETDFESFHAAACDVFEPIEPVQQLVRRLHCAGHRLGILSNTNEGHWRFIRGRCPIVGLFEQSALSYELGVMKPDRGIFEAAQRMAGVEAGQIFFVDDRPENVEGAREAGLDAVLFVDCPQLEKELRGRGLDG